MNAVTEQFYPCTAVHSSGRKLMSVRPGVSAKTALDEASSLLSMLSDALSAAGEGVAIEGNQAYLMLHALESSKAIIDAVALGLEAQQ
nr:DUF3077 domain-containing protein [[Pseudomonas] sp. BICA1-14]